MKRRLLTTFFACIVILFLVIVPKVSAAEDTHVTNNWTLSENTTINGNLYVDNVGVTVDLNGYILTVSGNVYSNGQIRVGSGALLVNGDVHQKKGNLYVYEGGTIRVSGNLIIRGENAFGDAQTGSSAFYSASGSTITVGGDYIYDSNATWFGYQKPEGTIYVAGNITLSGPSSETVQVANIVCNGSSTQELDIKNSIKLADLTFTNSNISIKGYLNYATIKSDANLVVAGDELVINQVSIEDNKKVNIIGNVLAKGDVIVNNGTLNVSGEYRQCMGSLYICNGAAIFEDNLLIQTVDFENRPITGTGYIELTGTAGKIKVAKDFIYDSNSMTNCMYDRYHNGTIYVGGNFTDTGENTRIFSNLVLNGNSDQLVELNTLNMQNITIENDKVSIKGTIVKAVIQNDCSVKIAGDYLTINNLTIGTNKVTMDGNIRANGSVWVDDGALTVKGDYSQTEGKLSVTTGLVDIKGNLYIQAYDTDDMPTTGEGYILLNGTSGKILVAHNFVYDSTSMNGSGHNGTVYVGGDFTDKGKSSRTFSNLVLNGTTNQTVDLKTLTMKKITLDNDEVTFTGKVNNAEFCGAKGKTIVVKDTLALLNYTSFTNESDITIEGDVVCDTINIKNSRVLVTGDYYQPSGTATITCSADTTTEGLFIRGNMYIASMNGGEIETGSGVLSCTNGRVSIGENMYINTSNKLKLDATFIVGGNIIESENNAKSLEFNVVELTGNNDVVISFTDNSKSYIKTLNIKYPIEFYSFDITSFAQKINGPTGWFTFKSKKCYYENGVRGFEFGMKTMGNKKYWYEGFVKQGTYDDANGVIGDGTVRGREIYDPESDGWYWLDACFEGAVAVSKEVWMPYIYQNEAGWSNDEIAMNAANSGDMAAQVTQAIKDKSGKWVRYDAEGKMYKGWYTVEGADAELYPTQAGNTYYYDPKTGLMAKGTVTIEGQTYNFDLVTGALIR